jgi:hypothetical protein
LILAIFRSVLMILKYRAWIEAATKGAVILFVASELEYRLRASFDMSAGAAGIMAGMGGGIAQA